MAKDTLSGSFDFTSLLRREVPLRMTGFGRVRGPKSHQAVDIRTKANKLNFRWLRRKHFGNQQKPASHRAASSRTTMPPDGPRWWTCQGKPRAVARRKRLRL